MNEEIKKRCIHTLQICTLTDKCSECWLTDVWGKEAKRYFNDMLKNLPIDWKTIKYDGNIPVYDPCKMWRPKDELKENGMPRKENERLTEVEAQRALTFVSNANAKLAAAGEEKRWDFMWDALHGAIMVALNSEEYNIDAAVADTRGGYRELIERLKK